MNQKHRGALSEMIAITRLLEQGYDVFRNVSQHGLADLVATNFDTGETLFVDVKTASETPSGSPRKKNIATKAQRRAGVRVVYVTHTGECLWPENQAVAVTAKTM